MEKGEIMKKTIKHEIKLQKSVIIILGILAVGVFANAFSVKDAMAELYDGARIYVHHSGSIDAR
jgi:hypothetical protein